MSSVFHPETHKFAAIIVAAGSSQRFGADMPKQYTPLAGKPVLRRTIEAFLKCPGLQEIRIVISPDHRAFYDAAVDGLDLPEPVMGGKERKDSVMNALKTLDHLTGTFPVLIHDGARPCIEPDLIEKTVDSLATCSAVSLATPMTDTIRKVDQGLLDTTINRTGIWSLQTPQGFHYDLISKAHAAAQDQQDITDDTGIVSAYGVDVKVIEGSRKNIKITVPEDIEMAEAFLNQSSQPQRVVKVAMGYDVHKLIPGNGTIRLGGIDMPHDKMLLGHSDADVILHAITDALLGTIGAADIGTYFPPSDQKWKNADSAIFLSKALELVIEKQGRIDHIDVSVLAEKPKLSPYREQIQRRIADILGIKPDEVGLKATTTEQLGFVGREEGIVAQAIATVSFPS